eukprot:6196005-Pleurochrysis_carterae.AAC.1
MESSHYERRMKASRCGRTRRRCRQQTCIEADSRCWAASGNRHEQTANKPLLGRANPCARSQTSSP